VKLLASKYSDKADPSQVSAHTISVGPSCMRRKATEKSLRATNQTLEDSTIGLDQEFTFYDGLLLGYGPPFMGGTVSTANLQGAFDGPKLDLF
jgi:hypothetical protein